MNTDAQAGQAAPPLHTAAQVEGETHAFQRLTNHKSAGVESPRRATGQFLALCVSINVPGNVQRFRVKRNPRDRSFTLHTDYGIQPKVNGSRLYASF